MRVIPTPVVTHVRCRPCTRRDFLIGLAASTLLWVPQILVLTQLAPLRFGTTEPPGAFPIAHNRYADDPLAPSEQLSGRGVEPSIEAPPPATSTPRPAAEGARAAAFTGRRPVGASLDSNPRVRSLGDGPIPDSPTSAPSYPLTTHMRCYARGDESELCVYENALCFDGKQVVVASAGETTTPYAPDFSSRRPSTASCFDFRFYEASAPEYTGCQYLPDSFARNRRKLLNKKVLSAPPLHPPTLDDGVGSDGGESGGDSTPWRGEFGNAFDSMTELEPVFLDRKIRSDWPIPFSSRRWGPGNRGEVVIGELAAAELFGPDPGLCEGCSAPPPAPDFGPSPPGITRVTQFGETTATWLDGPLWIVGVNAQYHIHPYHMATRLMALFTAQLSNATEFGENPADGFLVPFKKRSHPIETMWRYEIPLRRPPERRAAGEPDGGNAAGYFDDPDAPNRVQYMTGAQWDLPRMSYVAFAGPSADGLAVPSKNTRFVRGMLQLVAQKDTTFLFGNVSRKLSQHNLICASSGAIVGTHPFIFPARADAWLFRQTAYDWAGLTRDQVTSHDNHCPRKILVITRKTNGRVFSNDNEVIAAARRTGLDVEVIVDLSKLTLKDTVRKMSGVGIIVAAHGAALINTIFMPQHSAVIEIFPYYMKKQTYAQLAGVLGHFYFPMHSNRMPVRPNNSTAYAWRMLDSTPFVEHCIEQHVSTLDALLLHQCNSISKLLPIDVDIPALDALLYDAVDAIGAYSPFNMVMIAQSQSKSPTASPTSSPPSRKKKRIR